MLRLIRKLNKFRDMPSGKRLSLVEAECATCGSRWEILNQRFKAHNRRGSTYCGHCISDTYHRMSGTRVHRIWMGMLARAKDETDENYGARGVKVCDAWLDFRKFYADMAAGYSDDLTIERGDVNGDYCVENCTWVSAFAQQGNKRASRRVVYRGETIHLAELCRRTGLGRGLLTPRLNRGMTAAEAIRDANASYYPKNRKSRKRMT